MLALAYYEKLRILALRIIVIGILLSGFPVSMYSVVIYDIFFLPFSADYANLIIAIPFLVVAFIISGLIMLAVALSREKHGEIKEEIQPTTIIDLSYVKDIAIDLAGALSHYLSTPVKLRWNVIVIDADSSIHDDIRKFIEKFLEKNKMRKHRVVWNGKQFVILRITRIERFGLYQCIHCGALFNNPAHENYHRWAHYPKY